MDLWFREARPSSHSTRRLFWRGARILRRLRCLRLRATLGAAANPVALDFLLQIRRDAPPAPWANQG